MDQLQKEEKNPVQDTTKTVSPFVKDALKIEEEEAPDGIAAAEAVDKILNRANTKDVRNVSLDPPRKKYDGDYGALTIPIARLIRNSGSAANQNEIFDNKKNKIEAIESSDNSVISNKVVDDTTGELIDFPDRFKDSILSGLGYNNILYEREIDDRKSDMTNLPIDFGINNLKERITGESETKQREYLVPSYDKEGNPYLRLVKGSRKDMEERNDVQPLNKYGIPEESDNFVYSFLAGASNTLTSTDDLLIGFSKFAQDGVRLAAGSDFKENTWLDNLYENTIKDTHQNDFLQSEKSGEFGTLDWFGSGLGSAIGSLAQFGGLGRGVRAGAMGLKGLVELGGKKVVKDAVISKAASYGASGIMGFGHAYNEALQSDLDEADAWTYGLLVGGTVSAIESLMGSQFDDFLTGGGLKAVTRDIRESVKGPDITKAGSSWMKTTGAKYAKSIANASKGRGKTMAIEGTEEVLQDIAEQNGKIIYDNFVKEDVDAGFRHKHYDASQTLGSFIFGALAAAPFASAKPSIYNRVMNGQSGLVTAAADKMLSTGEVTKDQYIKIREEQHHIEELVKNNGDILKGIDVDSKYKNNLQGEIAGEIEKKAKIQSELDLQIEGLKDKDLSQVKEEAEKRNAVIEAKREELKKQNESLDRYRDSKFIQSRIEAYKKRDNDIQEAKNDVFKAINLQTEEGYSKTEEEFLARIGTLAPENYAQAKLVRNPGEANIAIQLLTNKKIDNKFKDIVARDVQDNFLYLSPLVNTDANRKALLALGVPLKNIPLTQSEIKKAELPTPDGKANDKFKGRYINFDQLNQMLATITDAEMLGNNKEATGQSKFKGHDKLNYLLQNLEKFGVTPAMLGTLDNRDQMKGLFSDEQQAAVSKLFDYGLAHNVLFADGLTSDARGAYTEGFLYVAGNINKLVKDAKVAKNKKERDQLFSVLVHETGHAIFDKELNRIFQAYFDFATGASKVATNDYVFFDRLYRLAMLSHMSLSDSSSAYKKSYFGGNIATSHLALQGDERTADSLRFVKEFFAEALSNEQFQSQLDSVDLNDKKIQSAIKLLGYKYNPIEGRQESLLAQALSAVASVFARLGKVFSQKERTLLSEAFILGSNINYNQFKKPLTNKDLNSIVRNDISLFSPLVLIDEQEFKKAEELSAKLMERISNSKERIFSKTAKDSLKKAIDKLVKDEILGEESPEFIEGSLIVVFFKGTNDLMISYKTSNPLDEKDQTEYNRVFFDKFGNRKYINTDITNSNDKTTLSKPATSVSFSSVLNDGEKLKDRQKLIDFDRAHREKFSGRAVLKLNENHSFFLDGQEYFGAVDIVYTFEDGSNSVIGNVPDLSKVRLSQLLKSGIPIEVKLKQEGIGSDSFVKRDENGNITELYPSTTNGLNPNEYTLAAVLPTASFTYVDGIKVNPAVTEIVNETDSITTSNRQVKPRNTRLDLLKDAAILNTNRIKNIGRSISFFNPPSADENRIPGFEPGTAEGAIEYLRSGVKRILNHQAVWNVGERFTKNDLFELANGYNAKQLKYLNSKFGNNPLFNNLGFENIEDYKKFMSDTVNDIMKEYKSSSNFMRADYSGLGGNPTGKISYAIRADLESINYEYNGSKHWMEFRAANQFLQRASDNTTTFDQMVENLKKLIDSRAYGGEQFVQIKAIHDHLIKERLGNEKVIFDKAKLTYWSQFGSQIRHDGMTISVKKGTAHVYMNGEDSFLAQMQNDMVQKAESIVNAIKDEVALNIAYNKTQKDKRTHRETDRIALYKQRANEHFVIQYSQKLQKENGLSKQQAIDKATIFLNNNNVQGQIRSLNTKASVSDFTGLKYYKNKSGYEKIKQLTLSYFSYLGTEIPESLFHFELNKELYDSLDNEKERLIKSGLRKNEAAIAIQKILDDKKYSYNSFVETKFTRNDAGTKHESVFPFALLALQTASFINMQIEKSFKGETFNLKTSELPYFTRAIMQKSGNYRSPEFYFNAEFDKEYAYKTRSRIDTLVSELAAEKSELLSEYLRVDAYKNNRFLQSIPLAKSKGKAVQIMLSGLNNKVSRNGVSYNSSSDLDYLYTNLGAFVFNYKSEFYYHMNDVPSDKPRNTGFALLRMKPEQLEAEVQNIIDIETARTKRFEDRFNKAFESIGNGYFKIKNQKAFDSLPVNVLFSKDANGYKKGYAFNPENFFYAGKAANEIAATINEEAQQSLDKWTKEGLDIPVPDFFIKNQERGYTENKVAKFKAEQARVYKEWYLNNTINRYHVSQVLMGDNIYYDPSNGGVDLSKRNAGANAPSNRPSFKQKQLKVALFDDVKIPTSLLMLKQNENNQHEIDYDANDGKGRNLGNVDSTDAQGYVTEQFAQEIRDAYGIFSPFESIFKPVVFGVSKGDLAYAQPLYLKLSLTILPNPGNPENYKDNPEAKSFAEKLYNSGANFGVFKSGVKVGARSINDTKGDSFNTIEFDSKLFGIQNNPFHEVNLDDNFINGAVQMTKQLGDNGVDNSNAKAMSEYHKIEGQVIDASAQEFFDTQMGDYRKINKTIKDELKGRDHTNVLSDFVDDDINVLENAVTAKMAENFINSMFKKAISLSRRDGEKLVNVSNFMSLRPDLSDEEKASRSNILSGMNIIGDFKRDLQWLGPRRPENLTLTQLKKLESDIAAYAKETGKDGKTKFINGQGFVLDNTGNVLIYPTEVLVPSGQNGKTNYIIGDRIIALRIPTSKKSNVIPAVVVGYTHKAQGNVIITSEHGPGILGFDFDIDGLFTWRERQKNENKNLSRMFDIAYGILTSPENYNEMTSPVNTSGLSKMADDLDGLKNGNDFKFSKWSPDRQLELKKLNGFGGEMISVSANYSGIHSVLTQNNGSPFVDSRKVERGYLYNRETHNKFVPSYTYNGEEVIISDIFSEFINASADNAKLQLIGRLGLNPNLARTAFDMIAHGVPMEYALLFINQPVIQEFDKIESSRRNISFVTYDNDVDIFLHLKNNLEAQIREINPNYANYSFDNIDAKGSSDPSSKAITIMNEGKLEFKSDQNELSIGTLRSGISGSVSGIGNQSDNKFNSLEAQLIALDKFMFYKSLAGISSKAGKIATLTSSFPKTFIELVKLRNDIQSVSIDKLDAKGKNLIAEKKIDIEGLLKFHGSYSIMWNRLNDFIKKYGENKLYALPRILEMHNELAGKASADVQENVMRDMYTYLLQFSEESDNENYKYNLSTSSLTGTRIDPYYFINQSANYIKAIQDAYPENEFLRLIQYVKNVVTEKQAEDKAVKPNEIIAKIFNDFDKTSLDRIRNAFLELPRDVDLTIGGTRVTIKSTQDVLLGHLLHTQGFRMGGLSFSKVLPVQTMKFIDAKLLKWKQDIEALGLPVELEGFPKQARLNHPELIRKVTSEKIAEQTTSVNANKPNIVRTTVADGGEVIHIKETALNKRFVQQLSKDGYIKTKDSSGKERIYDVSGITSQNGYRFITLKTINKRNYNNVKDYAKAIYFNNLSNKAIEDAVYLHEVEEEVAPLPVAFGTENIVSDVKAESIKNGDQTAITMNVFPDLKPNDIITIDTDSGPMQLKVTAVPNSLMEEFNKFVSNSLGSGDRLINSLDVKKFVEQHRRDGSLPKEFFTSNTIFKEYYNNVTGKREKNPESTLWNLNSLALYDLVDLETGEVVIPNVNLSTGRQMITDNNQMRELKERFVQDRLNVEGTTLTDEQLDDLIDKFQVPVSPVEDVSKRTKEVDVQSRVEKGLKYLKSNPNLDAETQDYFIQKLSNAKTNSDIDDIITELKNKCK